MSHKREQTLIIIAFLCVYIFWGSTFVGIRYAVAYITPAFVSGLRYLLGGALMLIVSALRGQTVRISRRELIRLSIIGLLLLTGNNVLLAWGEQYVSAGIASLIAASIPIMIALIETAIPGGEPLNATGWAGTFLGVAGLAVLLSPSIRGLHSLESHMAAVACIVLLGACVSWAVGSVIGRRWKSTADPMLASAWQMIIGGVVNVGIGTAADGWHTAHWTPGVFAALLWLAIFGSFVGYTAYTYLIHHVPVAKVATYAYVNPIVAVLLGALVLHEHLRPIEVAGMAVILIAVAIVTASKRTVPKDLAAARR